MNTIAVSRLDILAESNIHICSFCDIEVDVDLMVCPECDEYKGIVTLEEWESATGEVWE